MRKILLPISWVYLLITAGRNFLYDKKWLRSFEFDFPVIIIGNLSTGGTGKTPHIEYLIRLLNEDYHVAILSRGYKRKTKGFILSTEDSLVQDIGDEPKQIKQKYQDVEVAVCEDRFLGISALLQNTEDVDVILMDDGFQHRHVKAGFNILLTKYDQLFCNDYLLPAGNLREPKSGYKRAQVIIVTKCPHNLSKEIRENLQLLINPDHGQQLFFTSVYYGNMYPLFNGQSISKPDNIDHAFIVTGIAGKSGWSTYLKEKNIEAQEITFADHHYFDANDIFKIKSKAEQSSTSIIITTEKDAARLSEQKKSILNAGLSVFVLPVEIQFLFNEADNFNTLISYYIAQY